MRLAVILCSILLAGCSNSGAEAAKFKAEAELAKAEAAKLKADAEALLNKAKHDAELRGRLESDAIRRVKSNAQRMLDTAFPNAIGDVPFRKAEFDGLASMPDGFQATVKIYYTNILRDDYFMEIIISYDDMGGFRSWRMGHCNDRFPPNSRDKMFDAIIK